jgi:protein-disulfide isomerase
MLFIVFIILTFFLYKELKTGSEIKNHNDLNSKIRNHDENFENSKKKDDDSNDEVNSDQNAEKAFDKNLSSLQENDIFIGNKDAKVVMIEYDSLTCPHCKEFHDKIFDSIKKKYIYTGKVLYISRAFPTDGMSFRLSLAVMYGKNNEEKLNLRSLVFKNQEMIYKNFEGANFEDKSEKNADDMKKRADKVLENFVTIFEIAGCEREKIKSCMDPEHSKENSDFLLAQSGNAFKSPYKISSAPTFLINGKMYNGAQTVEFWEKIIDKELGENKG